MLITQSLWNFASVLAAYVKSESDIHGSVQGCSISSALAMEILQSCTKPSI